MSMVPTVAIRFEEVGASGVSAALDELSYGLEEVAEAGDDAAKAVDKAGKSAGAAQTRMGKLWDTLKKNAGAASGAAAGLATVSAILNSDMSPAAKTATGVAQGLTAVLSAFGPIGQLAGAAVSGLSSLLIPLIDKMEGTAEVIEGPFEAAWKKLAKGFQTAKQALAEFQGKTGLAGASEQLLTFASPQMLARWETLGHAITGNKIRIYELQDALRSVATEQEQAVARQRVEQLKLALELEQRAQRLTGMRTEEIKRLSQERLALQEKLVGREQNAADLAKLQLDTRKKIAEQGRIEERAAGGGAGKRAMTDHEAYLKVEALRLAAVAAFEKKAQEVRDYFAERRAQADAEREARAVAMLQDRDRQVAAFEERRRAEAQAQAQALADEQAAISSRIESMLESTSQAMAEAAAASLLFNDSVAEAAKGVLKQLAVQAGGEALMESARAIAALGKYLTTPWAGNLLASAKAHGLAALKFGAIAGGAALGANALGGASKAGATAAGNRAPTARDLESPARQREAAGPTTINTNFVAGGPLSRVMAREYALSEGDFRRRSALGAVA